MTELAVIITATSRTGLSDARIPALGRGMCLKGSRTPFLDAARALVAAGYPADAMLVMRRQGQAGIALRGLIGAAAKLTVRETPFGPRFSPYQAFPSAAPTIPVGSHSEFPEDVATNHRVDLAEALE